MSISAVAENLGLHSGGRGRNVSLAWGMVTATQEHVAAAPASLPEWAGTWGVSHSGRQGPGLVTSRTPSLAL